MRQPSLVVPVIQSTVKSLFTLIVCLSFVDELEEGMMKYGVLGIMYSFGKALIFLGFLTQWNWLVD